MNRLYCKCPRYVTPMYSQNFVYGASVDLDAPLPPMRVDVFKIGLLTNQSNTELLNLFAVPIMPNQGVINYYATDKYGFRIPLKPKRPIENGDQIDNIPGKNGIWTAIIEINKFVFI